MKTLGEILNLSVSFLKEKTCPRSRRDAEEIIASVLGIKGLDLYMQFDRPMEESELQEIRGSKARCESGTHRIISENVIFIAVLCL